MWEDSSCEKTVYVGRQFIREDSSLEKTVYVGRQFMWDPKHKSIKVLLYTNFLKIQENSSFFCGKC